MYQPQFDLFICMRKLDKKWEGTQEEEMKKMTARRWWWFSVLAYMFWCCTISVSFLCVSMNFDILMFSVLKNLSQRFVVFYCLNIVASWLFPKWGVEVLECNNFTFSVFHTKQNCFWFLATFWHRLGFLTKAFEIFS